MDQSTSDMMARSISITERKRQYNRQRYSQLTDLQRDDRRRRQRANYNTSSHLSMPNPHDELSIPNSGMIASSSTHNFIESDNIMDDGIRFFLESNDNEGFTTNPYREVEEEGYTYYDDESSIPNVENQIDELLHAEAMNVGHELSSNVDEHGDTEMPNMDIELLVNITLETHKFKPQKNCTYCGAKRFQHEPPSFCCQIGKVSLAPTPVSDELYHLFTAQDNESIEFRHSVRGYNSHFSFTSMGVTLDQALSNMRSGVYTFQAQGQIYHFINQLQPDTEGPKYLQLYFYDTQYEVDLRLKRTPNLNRNVVEKIMNVLTDNPYARFFKSLRDVIINDEYKIVINTGVSLDQRVYNQPTASQVAAVWIEGNESSGRQQRNIIVKGKTDRPYLIKSYYGCYDPLSYPLLFTKGEMGWHQKIHKVVAGNVPRPSTSIDSNTLQTVEDVFNWEEQGPDGQKGNFVSVRQYYCYKLQIQPAERSILLRAGRLFQQFVVDMYIKIESTRLNFIANGQSRIRADLYQGISDSVLAGESRGNSIGKRIILPASFIGGPRDMRRRYLDAMALVQYFGKPDIFLTITCNPEWEEIKNELNCGEIAQDRPDLAARVFRAKIEDLKDQLFKKNYFGVVASRVHVIEFQKRGLPHAHFLIIMHPTFKITTPDQYDQIVCSEIPDPQKYPELHKLVEKHMMHGPCGVLRRNSPCMRNGTCRFRYPRQFCSKTMQGKDSYPIYHRRNSGISLHLRGATLDNRWVAPYNPYLLMRYQCHLNVEICSSIKAVKYLFKYIYKGHDRASVNIEPDTTNQVDEVRQFQDARWVSPPEAMWRIYEFNLSEMYPAVMQLQLHLENMQIVSYEENEDLNNVLSRERSMRTTLTEYFKINMIDMEARKYLYREFPMHYVWQHAVRRWTARKQRGSIGRIVAANPTEGERYYLRMLLNHVRGATSYADLLNANGHPCGTFRESAQRRGLIENDDSISNCLTEASNFDFPAALRRLFATILVYCEPENVRALWDNHFEAMSEDFRREDNATDDTILQKVLKSIKNFLESMGKTIEEYDLPAVINSEDQCSIGREITDELSIPFAGDLLDIPKLNNDQRKAFDEILSRVLSNKSGVFFIDGPGGTGKTFLYKSLLSKVRSIGLIAIATATSGVAASILPGGRTAHSRFKIPLKFEGDVVCNIRKQSGIAELLRKSSLIIWDEASMTKKQAFEALDRTLQDIMDSHVTFGGKVIVFGGDFRQVLPVVRRGTRGETVASSLCKSYLWQKMKKFTLTQNMRAFTDPTFCEFLLNVGNGTHETIRDDLIKIPDDLVVPFVNEHSSRKSLIQAIFPSLDRENFDYDSLKDSAILCTKNEYIDALNDEMINQFCGEKRVYYSFDTAVDDTQNHYPQEFLNSLTPNGLPSHVLALKKNCPIMLLRNIDPPNGLCNGTRLICKDFQRDAVDAEIACGQHKGRRVFIPRIPLYPAEDDNLPFKFKRKQFPLRLCFAMTINKSQGQTVPRVGIYLPQHVFSHGQLYVALSRGVSRHSTKVIVKPQEENLPIGTYTRNIVYKEVLIS